MRLRVWAAGAPWCPVLVLLVVLTVPHVHASQEPASRERRFYIAAVEIDWKYDLHRSGPTYKKVVFREYDEGFKQAKTHPSWLGLLGPTLRAEEGETIVVTFRNMAPGAYSIHPHGVAYGKQSEGANYFDNTSQKEKEDDIVQQNEEHVYTWEVTPDVSPQPNDPTCLTYTYISHRDVVEDYNSGLIGTLLICKPGSLDESGQQVGVHHEFVFLFGVFDEKESRYKTSGYDLDNHVKYTINGYTKGSLPDVKMCAHAPVSLHLVGMSSEPEVFSVHLNGHVLEHMGHKLSSVGLISGATATATVVPVYRGRWLLSSYTNKHMEVGLHGFVDVEKCDAFKAPVRWMTIEQKRQSREWKYYIAAEEVVWDYAPNAPDHVDEDFRLQYLKQSSTRIGRRYKKAVYTMYSNESFTEKIEQKKELGILGPVIRAQIRDVITIVFKNMASRPYSIYPHGLTIEKLDEGANYPEGGNQSHAVQPGETRTYIWRVLEEDQSLDGDPRCLTRMYHSAVDTPRDIASGLIGPLLICKDQSLNVRNVQLKADKEQHAMFAVFDENKSWYLDYNIGHYCDRTKISKGDSDFYKSNVMHTINGHVFESGPVLGFCHNEVATWHVSSVGAQNHIQTATFYGHPFELNERIEDYLSLYPMTGESITMPMSQTGVWLLASLNSHETTKGMRLKFRDVECFRDYTYEYEDTSNHFNEWSPDSFVDLEKKEESKKKEEGEKKEPEPEPEPINKKSVSEEPDIYTAMFAEELGLRSLKNQTVDPEVEKLDLSFLDYDAVDVADGDMTTTKKFTKKKINNGTIVSQPKTRNETDGTVDLQSIIGNTTHVQNTRNASTVDNSTLKTENTTTINSPKALLKNDSSASLAIADLDNDAVSIKENSTIDSEMTNLTTALQDSTNPTVTPTGNTSSPMHVENITDTLTSDNQTSVGKISSEESKEKLRGNGGYGGQGSSESSEEVFIYLADGDNSAKVIKTTSVKTQGRNWTYDVKHEVESVEIPDHMMKYLETSEPTPEPTSEATSEAYPEPTFAAYPDATPDTTSETYPDATPEATSEAYLDTIPEATSETYLDKIPEATSETYLDTTPEATSEAYLDTIPEATSEAYLDTIPEATSETYLDTTPEATSEAYLDTIPEATSETYLDTIPEATSEAYPEATPDTTSETYPETTPETTPESTPSPAPTPAPTPKKKTKRVTLRQRPQRGEGMKTKRRKEYKPLARSGLPNALPFSPRGFNPMMTPRGSRPGAPQPFSDEEELINMPVVIGVPRPDFSDYELYVPGNEPDHLGLDEHDVHADEYEWVSYKDPYSGHEDIKNLNLDETIKHHLKILGQKTKMYFIAAEEVQWDYAGYGQRRQDKLPLSNRETSFTKVVFRRYTDSSFSTPDVRGELDEHLGILGPVIKAEVGESILVTFRNNAKRPYSIHPNGVTYAKQSEGLSYEDDSTYWFKYDNEVQPNDTFTYLWKATDKAGPTSEESDCRTWAYYSGVNPEKDIHSGLIGPLLVCREGTLSKGLSDMREFMLLFMTFDESQSWYYEQNREFIQRKTRRRTLGPFFKENLKFHSINGIIFNLKGLRMYTKQLARWHLINMGSPNDFQSVHFHGQTFINKHGKSHRQAVFPMLPGSFATLEMYPSRPGLWQLETEVGSNQKNGMQTLFLVLDDDCARPLGLESGSVTDEQITATSTRGYWEPHLARLNNQGKYNAWSTDEGNSWIQVDFQRPVVISQVATQGAKQMFQSQYVDRYLISYSTDRRSWTFYKGDSRDLMKVFDGNQEAYSTKRNVFFPPVVGRFIRLYPLHWYSKPTVRMEFYGCELDGCSVPLGIENRLIEDRFITASSTASSWYSGPWTASHARLNKQGTINAWQAKFNDMNQWLQVELPQVKKITGIITQGAKSLGKEMYVTTYTLLYSHNGMHWIPYSDDEDLMVKVFSGNTNNNDHVKNYIYPPIFSRFIRIVPTSWMSSITMRIELLGCDFE